MSEIKQAVYAGSFDPFTNGHLEAVKKCVAIFNKTHIVIADNSEKYRLIPAICMVDVIKEVLEKEGLSDKCEVVYTRGLIAEYAKTHQIGFMVRGLRNNLDYNYEENIAEVNKLIYPQLDTIYLRADNRAISSSMIKECIRYNQPVDKYVPYDLIQVIKMVKGMA